MKYTYMRTLDFDRGMAICSMADKTEDSDQMTLEFISPDRPPGTVNSLCSFTDNNSQRFIQIRGAHCYVYDLDDRVSASVIWIQIHRAGHAKLAEIAKATEFSLRSLDRWHAKFKAGGVDGLSRKAGSGRPQSIPEVSRELAVMLTESGKTPGQVTKQLGISYTSLRRILEEHNESPSEQWLDLGDDHSLDMDELNPEPPPPGITLVCALPDSDPPVIEQPAPSTNPDDRSVDRNLAVLGLHYDATPVFTTDKTITGAGFFMLVALLSQTRVLDIFENIYSKSLGPAFYGLRTTVMTLLMMFARRIKRPEHLRQYNPINTGRALGLDRCMEVKTLRSKLSILADQGRSVELMGLLAEDRIDRHPEPTGEQLNALYLDGHVNCYCGKFNIGKTWSATKNRVVKGKTNTWLNPPGQTPFIYLESPFNEGLVSMMEQNKDAIEKLYGGKPVLVFDREGWDVDFLHDLDEAGWKFITYRKGNYESLPVEDFETVDTRIGKRTYAHAPVDIDKQNFNHHQTIENEDGSKSRKKVGQVSFREIRILSDDRTHQTSIVTNLTKAEATSVITCATLFERWGNQENVFKYMIADYGLDDLWEYNRGDERINDSRKSEEYIPDHIDHPNPDYTRLSKELSLKAAQRTKILARHGLVLETKVGAGTTAITTEELAKLIDNISSGKDAVQLKKLNQEISDLRAKRDATPKREPVAPAGYKQLRSSVSHIVDSLKMVAFELETQLFNMLAPHYPNQPKEGRKLIAAALNTAGSLRIESGKLIVRLEAQSSPNRTDAIDRVCQELNQLGALYPGTELTIEFDTDRG